MSLKHKEEHFHQPPKEISQMKKIIAGVGLVLTIGLFFSLFNWTKIEGNERAVVQDWKDGVQEEIWTSGTNFYVPFTTTPYVYDIGAGKFIMGKEQYYSGVGQDTVDYPAFTLTVGGEGNEQPVTFSVTLNYQLDPSKLVTLHNKAQNNYEDLIIKPNLTRLLSNAATTKHVLSFYTGSGRVELQNEIEEAIRTHPALSEIGVIVDTFVIDSIDLDAAYVAEIQGRQLATQKRLRAVEERKAADEIAKKEEALAQADKLRRIVAAEASKQESIKAAEADKQQRVLASEAQAQEIKNKATAERYRKEQDAKGLLAQGLAEAQVAKEKRDSKYSGVAGERQALVEITQAKVEMFKNFNPKGIVPEGTTLNLIQGAMTDVKPVLNVSSKK